MPPQPAMHDQGRPLRFGPFELDLTAGELRAGRQTVRLQEQPFVILQMLLEKRGQVVTRDELRQRLWPEGTFVDFEHSLNAAVKRLRAALGDDADSPRYIETIPRRGYRFVAGEDESEPQGIDAGGLPESYLRLAVLPFSAVGAPQPDDYFGDGFTEEMISELGRRGRSRLAVISSHSSRTFKNTTARARDIGLALRADYLLEGSVRQSGGRVRITARLIATASETQLWADTYEQPLTDWLAVQAEIAARIAQSLAVELLPAAPTAAADLRDHRAHDAFLKGRYHYQRVADTGTAEAFHFFQEAVDRDPSFAPAAAGLAMVEVMRAAYYHEVPRHALERAREAANRASRLDPSLADTHLADGDVRRFLLWDHRGARHAYRTAISLNPSLESARTAHAKLLASLGRFGDSVREADVGRELDPRCLTANTVAAWARYAAGDYGAASELCRHTLELDDSHTAARQLLSAALIAAGSRKEAIRVLQAGLETAAHSPILLASLAYASAVCQDRLGAEQWLERLKAPTDARYVSSYHLAIAFAGLGNIDEAFAALARACDDRDPMVTNVAVDPRLHTLRTDARYQPLLIRLRLHEFHSH
jgi:TolB-like protein/Flp pilus assembly protein TadD